MVEHCCEQMTSHLADGEVCIRFSAKYREYGLLYLPEFGESIQLINFCPWCGARLPTPLGDRWYSELEQLGIHEPDNGVPEEFMSEAWWQNRSL